MKRNIGLLTLIGLTLLLSGCVDHTVQVYVNKDGTGIITETTYFSNSMTEMMSGMAGAFGGNTAQQPDLIGQELTPEKLAEKAAAYGPDVTVRSSERLTAADGRQGYKIHFDFFDVNEISVGTKQTAPTGDAAAETDPADNQPLGFAFTPGNQPVLTIYLPQEKTGDTAADESKSTSPLANKKVENEEDLAEVKKIFGDFRMWIRVKVEGDIINTNASYVNPANNGITLMQMDFGKMLELAGQDPQSFQKWSEENDDLFQSGDFMTRRKAMKEMEKKFPFFKFETADKITIQFE